MTLGACLRLRVMLASQAACSCKRKPIRRAVLDGAARSRAFSTRRNPAWRGDVPSRRTPSNGFARARCSSRHLASLGCAHERIGAFSAQRTVLRAENSPPRREQFARANRKLTCWSRLGRVARRSDDLQASCAPAWSAWTVLRCGAWCATNERRARYCALRLFFQCQGLGRSEVRSGSSRTSTPHFTASNNSFGKSSAGNTPNVFAIWNRVSTVKSDFPLSMHDICEGVGPPSLCSPCRDIPLSIRRSRMCAPIRGP